MFSSVSLSEKGLTNSQNLSNMRYSDPCGNWTFKNDLPDHFRRKHQIAQGFNGFSMGSKKKGCGAFTHFHMFVKFIQNCSPTLSIFAWSYAHFTSSIHIHSLLYSSAGSHRFINSEKEIVSNLQKTLAFH